MTKLQHALKIIGYGAASKIARRCNVTPQAVKKWADAGVLPVTEITEIWGDRKTSYGLAIEALTDGQVTDADLRQENFEYRQLKNSAA